ncbi:3524_t:CDS:2 [Funneliformis mosseae]|uniref:3524_t:CDS:1 n=1 Tax=Funneliformis mosseae TaxID=27381 RepID=A0A9N9C1R6_FUNMO|nr:3524_t:CDS:2 [Funneliformis mosseae]
MFEICAQKSDFADDLHRIAKTVRVAKFDSESSGEQCERNKKDKP